MDKFIAYKQFVGRKLLDGDLVDVYLAHLRHLGVLFGGIPDAGLCSSSRDMQFGVEDCKATVVTTNTVTIDEKDFKVVHDEQANEWTVSWK